MIQYHIRPFTSEDTSALMQLMRSAPVRLRHFSKNTETLEQQLHACLKSDGSTKLWLLLNTTDHKTKINGFASINLNAGNHEPFYNYNNDQLIHHSRHLNITKTVNVLHLSHHLTGLLQLADSYCRAEVPQQISAYLTLIRLFYFYQSSINNPIQKDIICEVANVQNSLFWQQVAQPFFQHSMDHSPLPPLTEHDANEIIIKHGKTVVAELLPYHPIYCDLLTNDCQQQLAEVAPEFVDLTSTLHRIGFYKTRFIDVFDGGPVWRFKHQDLKTFFETAFCDQQHANIVIDANYSLSLINQKHKSASSTPLNATTLRWSL